VLHSGRVDFGEMEVVVFGRRAAEGARQREAEGVFLMTSGTLNRTTDDVANIRAKFIDANKRRFGLRDGGVGPVARCQTHQPTQAAGPSEGVGPRDAMGQAARRWHHRRCG